MARPKAVLFQVKYTNQCPMVLPDHGAGNCMTSDQGCVREGVEEGLRRCTKGRFVGLSVSGSDQAREGRLVDALAARGDEGRDTLR